MPIGSGFSMVRNGMVRDPWNDVLYSIFASWIKSNIPLAFRER